MMDPKEERQILLRVLEDVKNSVLKSDGVVKFKVMVQFADGYKITNTSLTDRQRYEVDQAKDKQLLQEQRGKK